MKKILLLLIPLFSLISAITVSAENYENIKKEEIVQEYYPSRGNVVITTCSLHLRDAPDGHVLKTLEQGTMLIVNDISGDWAKVNGGWVYAGYLSESLSLSPIPVECDSKLASSCAGAVQNALSYVPDNVARKIAEKGYKIIITDSDVKKDNKYGEGDSNGDAVGCTVFPKKIILAEAGNEYLEWTILHELGHAYDHALGFISEEDYFQKIFIAEAETAAEEWEMDYVGTDSLELFADAFFRYIKYDTAYFQALPYLYEYISDIL